MGHWWHLAGQAALSALAAILLLIVLTKPVVTGEAAIR